MAPLQLLSVRMSEYTMGLAVGAALGGVATAIACVLTSKNNATASGVRLPVAASGMARAKGEPRAPQYHSGVIKVKEGMLDQYTALHDHTWDEVMAKMHEVNPSPTSAARGAPPPKPTWLYCTTTTLELHALRCTFLPDLLKALPCHAGEHA